MRTFVLSIENRIYEGELKHVKYYFNKKIKETTQCLQSRTHFRTKYKRAFLKSSVLFSLKYVIEPTPSNMKKNKQQPERDKNMDNQLGQARIITHLKPDAGNADNWHLEDVHFEKPEPKYKKRPILGSFSVQWHHDR